MYSCCVVCFLWLIWINMGCKDSVFQLQRNTSWAKSVNCIWNRTDPSCISFLPADGCTVISFVLLAAKAASPWVLEYVKKFTPEGRCFLSSYLATLVLEEREKKGLGKMGEKSWRVLRERRKPSGEQQPFSFGHTHTPLVSICLGLLDTSQGYADSQMMWSSRWNSSLEQSLPSSSF